MLFGQSINQKITLGITAITLFIASCKNESKNYITFSAPTQGQQIKLGEPIELSLDIDKSEQIVAINYYVDGTLKASLKDNSGKVTIASKDLSLGYRNIMAVVTKDGEKDTITTNIILTSNVAPKPLSYTVVKTFPHDTSAYTEGLSFVDASLPGRQGKLLESTGEKGASKLKYVDLNSGKVLLQTQLAPEYFGEGSLKIGDKIIMLTWQENIGFVFDAKTFKQLATFPYQNSREGWGLTFDGKKILRSDGTNRIWLMNADNYKEEGFIEVYDDKGAVDSINELEYINGKIYANVYLTNNIIVIDPKTGVVESRLDLSALVPKNFFKAEFDINNNVLNGIAWDAKQQRLFVGGKKWPKLYEIKVK